MGSMVVPIRANQLLPQILLEPFQGSHRLEKYLKMKGCLEKYLKTKFALKSTGKLAIGLEKHLNFTSSGIPDNKIRFQNQM